MIHSAYYTIFADVNWCIQWQERQLWLHIGHWRCWIYWKSYGYWSDISWILSCSCW